MYNLVLAVLFQFVFVARTYAQTLSISVPLSAPPGAATLSPTLFSLSIEQDTWTDWAGIDGPNTFLVNVLDNLKQRTGEPPWFRIGADSEDRTNFNPNIQIVVVGDGYYQIADNLPAGTRVVWGVNLGSDNITAAVLESLSIKKAFDSHAMKTAGVTLEFIEIGNEPDLYKVQCLRSCALSAPHFAHAEFATNMSFAGAIQPGLGPKFFGPSFALISHTADSFSALGVFTQGILETPPGSLLRTYSQHHYQCGGGENLTDIVIKQNIRGNLTQLLPDIALVRSHGLDYVLGETNSCSGHGAVNTSNVGGIATWTLDYLLFAAQVGVSRLFFHQGVGYKYNAIQPVTLTRSITDGSPLSTPLPPHVQPAYYAALVAAEAIGTSGVSTSVELDIDDDDVSGYAIYERGVLKRAVLISHTMFFAGSAVPRGVKHIALDFAGAKAPNGKINLKRLFIPSADATSGLIWGGQSFDGPDGKASGKMVLEQSSVDSVALSDTEIILLLF
ncbi:glycoside hydrolase family 79 protein [Mycena latifolia]|nr:glycoside hydrolase family 79 protein [Mycena latifolia]